MGRKIKEPGQFLDGQDGYNFITGTQTHPFITIALANYPQLRLIAWNRRDDYMIDEREAFALYEANWRFIEPDSLDERERELLRYLVQTVGGGVLNV